MRRCLLSALTLAALVLGISAAPPDESAIKSGPPVGSDLPGPFHPFNVTGKQKDKFHCLVSAHGLNPGVLVFAEASLNSETFIKLLQELDGAVGKYQKQRLGAFAILLSDDVKENDSRDKLKSTIADLGSKLKDQAVLAIDEANGPKDYKIVPKTITVILYNRHEVKANYTFDGVMTDKDVATIMADVAKLVAPKK